MVIRALLLSLLLPASALADCQPGDERWDERAALHTALANATDETAADAIADSLWRIWTVAPDETAQFLLDKAMARRDAWDFAQAEDLLDELVAYCPDYAEGWNQRAFVRFLRENYDAALEDIAKALALNPYHFGALSGRAVTLMRQGHFDEGQAELRRALKVHPFLKERAMLVPLKDDSL